MNPLADKITSSLEAFTDKLKKDEPIMVTTVSRHKPVTAEDTENLAKALDVILKLPPTPKRKPLVERVKWEKRESWLQICEHAGLEVRLIKDVQGKWAVKYREGDWYRYFDCKGGWKAAKIEALRIVQAAVLEAAEAWRD